MATDSKICAFMTQKGGAGKSVLTNILPNEIILWHLLHSGKQVNVLVVDIDPQQTNTAKRKRDIEQLSYKETSPEFLAMDLGQKTEIGSFSAATHCSSTQDSKPTKCNMSIWETTHKYPEHWRIYSIRNMTMFLSTSPER